MNTSRMVSVCGACAVLVISAFVMPGCRDRCEQKMHDSGSGGDVSGASRRSDDIPAEFENRVQDKLRYLVPYMELKGKVTDLATSQELYTIFSKMTDKEFATEIFDRDTGRMVAAFGLQGGLFQELWPGSEKPPRHFSEYGAPYKHGANHTLYGTTSHRILDLFLVTWLCDGGPKAPDAPNIPLFFKEIVRNGEILKDRAFVSDRECIVIREERIVSAGAGQNDQHGPSVPNIVFTTLFVDAEDLIVRRLEIKSAHEHIALELDYAVKSRVPQDAVWDIRPPKQ